MGTLLAKEILLLTGFNHLLMPYALTIKQTKIKMQFQIDFHAENENNH